jgi:hypothetical protein
MATIFHEWDAQDEKILNTVMNGSQHGVAVAGGVAGDRYLAAWTEPGLGNDDIAGRIFDARGMPLVAQFKLSTGLAGDQDQVSLAGLHSGRFVAAFTTNGNIYRSTFNRDGSAVALDALVATSGEELSDPDVAALADGGYVVSYTWLGPMTSVRGRIYDADGSFRGNVTINTTDASDASVAGLAGGGFVTAWVRTIGGSSSVYFRRFDANGNGLDGAGGVLIDATGSINQDIQVAALPDGGFVVAYTDNGWSLSGTEITARVFNADGSTRSGFRRVNEETDDDQDRPTLTVLSDGYFMVGWADDGELRGRPYDSSGAPIAPSALLAFIHDEGEIAGLSPGQFAAVYRPFDSAASGDELVRGRISELYRDVIGDDSNETIVAGDALPDRIDGKDGDDIVVFSHDLGAYTLQDFGDTIRTSGPQGPDLLRNVEHLQFADGTLHLVEDGDLLFDTPYYLSRHTDVFHAGVNARDHFNAHGWHEGRDPNPLFDVSGYLAVNKDVAAAGVNPLEHYRHGGWREGRDPGLGFDVTLYLIHNPDVAAAGIDPLGHYLRFGADEGRTAPMAVGAISGGFDAQYYLLVNTDVAAAGVDALAHYKLFGWQEGRDPNGWFDSDGYLAHYADVAASGVNPLEHYRQFGWKESRDPSAGFDTLGYLAANPDVAAAQVDPLQHFLTFGIYEGRKAVSDGVWS